MLKEILYALLVKLATGVQVIGVFFVSAILAKKGPVVAAVALSISIWVVFAENLEISLTISDNTFYNNIGLNNKRLFSISIAVIFGLTS